MRLLGWTEKLGVRYGGRKEFPYPMSLGHPLLQLTRDEQTYL